jgi:hypothetical protein
MREQLIWGKPAGWRAADPERAKSPGQSGADPAPFGDPFVVVSALVPHVGRVLILGFLFGRHIWTR